MIVKNSIGTRLAAGFGILIVVFAFSGWLTLSRMNFTNNRMKEIVDRRVAAIEDVHSMREASFDGQLAVLKMFLVRDESELPQLLSANAAGKQRVTEIGKHLEGLLQSGVETTLFEQIRAVRAPFNDSSTKAKQLLAEGRRYEAISEVFDTTLPRMEKYNQMWERLEAHEKDLLRQSVAESEASYANTRMLVLLMFVLVVAAGVVFSVLVTRSITSPIARVLKRAESVAGGDLEYTEERYAKPGSCWPR